MLNTNVNVEIQELNVKEVLLANPSVVMLLMLNTTNTVGGDQKTYPILAGAHKAERGARYCSAHGVSQYTLIYIAMRLVVNSCVARNADIGGRTTLSPSPEAAESARRTQRRCLFALRASRNSDARTNSISAVETQHLFT